MLRRQLIAKLQNLWVLSWYLTGGDVTTTPTNQSRRLRRLVKSKIASTLTRAMSQGQMAAMLCLEVAATSP